MTRATFRKADVTRAIEATKAAGLKVVSVEVRRDGSIRVITDLTAVKGSGLTSWDRTCAAE